MKWLNEFREDEEKIGMLYGLIAVIAFSLTLPATRIAVTQFSPTVAGLGRALVAAALAAVVLLIKKQQLPSFEQLKSLLIVAFGVIVGFPLLSAWAMARVPASHGAVIIALLPLATAGVAALRGGEHPTRKFWIASLTGCVVVIGFAIISGVNQLNNADLALLGAVVAAAFGYAEGGKLARTLGGWQVISWALLISFPILIWPVAIDLSWKMFDASWEVWFSFSYVAVISQFLAFFAWYRGMALGGIARVSQLQYLQPFFTILGSAVLLGEDISLSTIVVTLVVVYIVAQGRKAPVTHKTMRT